MPGLTELCACGHNYGIHTHGMAGRCSTGCGCPHFTDPPRFPEPDPLPTVQSGWEIELEEAKEQVALLRRELDELQAEYRKLQESLLEGDDS